MHVRDAIAKAVTDAFRLAGVPATFTPPGGETSACVVVLDCGGGRTDADLHLSVRTLGKILVRESESPTGEFPRGGIFEVGSERWSILRTMSRNGGVFTLEVQRESK